MNRKSCLPKVYFCAPLLMLASLDASLNTIILSDDIGYQMQSVTRPEVDASNQLIFESPLLAPGTLSLTIDFRLDWGRSANIDEITTGLLPEANAIEFASINASSSGIMNFAVGERPKLKH